MNTKINHIYIGNVDRLPQWAGISTEEDVECGELSDDNLHKVVGKVRELIKNYLQLDSVNFLFWNWLFYSSWCCQYSEHSKTGRGGYCKLW